MMLGFRCQNNVMKKIASYKGVPKVETGNGSISGLIFRDWKPVLALLLFQQLAQSRTFELSKCDPLLSIILVN